MDACSCAAEPLYVSCGPIAPPLAHHRDRQNACIDMVDRSANLLLELPNAYSFKF